MKEVIKRLKSPVIIGQIITNIAGIVVLLLPEQTDMVNAIVVAIMTIVNVFAGLNNPSDKNNF